jgi:nucleoside-diphosphate-sugar epimerase
MSAGAPGVMRVRPSHAELRLLDLQETRRGTVMVLGGSGFVGAAIVTALRQAGFATVSAQRRMGPPHAGTTQQPWDATQPADIRPLLQGAVGVVNAVSGDSRTMLAASRTLAAAAREGCKIVHVSSMSVYGQTRGYVSETTALRASSRYAAAKIACEACLAGTGATLLRPGIVYGPGSTQWVGRIGRLLRAGRLGDLGKHGDGRCNLVHVRDLAKVVLAALGTADAHGRAINIGMPAPPRWNDYLVALGRAIGAVPVQRIPGWRLSLEVGLLAPPLHLAGVTTRRFAGPSGILPEPLSPALCRVFAQDIVLDCSLSDRLLASPRICLAEGMAESAAWFLETLGLARG